MYNIKKRGNYLPIYLDNFLNIFFIVMYFTFWMGKDLGPSLKGPLKFFILDTYFLPSIALWVWQVYNKLKLNMNVHSWRLNWYWSYRFLSHTLFTFHCSCMSTMTPGAKICEISKTSSANYKCTFFKSNFFNKKHIKYKIQCYTAVLCSTVASQQEGSQCFVFSVLFVPE